MKLTHIAFTGPPIDDEATLARLSPELANLLQHTNGFVQHGGGLHVRGACLEPDWHALRNAWEGPDSVHQLYPDVRALDVPCAEDCLGDQFLLRDGTVWTLAAETGYLKSLDVGLMEFLERTQAEPVEYLSLQPLLRFLHDGGTLEPGQLLSVYPPYCVKSEGAVSLRAIPNLERRRFLADFARQIRDVPDGRTIQFKVVE
jgi:hypothetical protein